MNKKMKWVLMALAVFVFCEDAFCRGTPVKPPTETNDAVRLMDLNSAINALDSKIKLVCMGDSMTAQTTSYLKPLKEWHAGWVITNFGISGNSTTQMLARMNTTTNQIDTNYFNILVLGTGVNDYAAGSALTRTIEHSYTNIGLITEYALTNGFQRVIVWEPPPFSLNVFGDINQFTYTLRDLLVENKQRYNYELVHWTDRVTGQTGILLEKYWLTYPTDPHPNAEAHKILAKEIEGAIIGGRNLAKPKKYNGAITLPKSLSNYGLYTQYKMDIITATNVVDSIGSNSTSEAASYGFDITNSFVYCQFDTNKTTGFAANITGVTSNEFTMCGFFRTTREWGLTNDIQYFLTLRKPGVANAFLTFFNDASYSVNATGVLTNGSAVTIAANIPWRFNPYNTRWKHYGITYNRATPKVSMYIDGVCVATNTTVTLASLNDWQEIVVGNVYAGSPTQFFVGDARDVRYYTRELSAGEMFLIGSGNEL